VENVGKRLSQPPGPGELDGCRYATPRSFRQPAAFRACYPLTNSALPTSYPQLGITGQVGRRPSPLAVLRRRYRGDAQRIKLLTLCITLLKGAEKHSGGPRGTAEAAGAAGTRPYSFGLLVVHLRTVQPMTVIHRCGHRASYFMRTSKNSPAVAVRSGNRP
jgi:hypothetical protein